MSSDEHNLRRLELDFFFRYEDFGKYGIWVIENRGWFATNDWKKLNSCLSICVERSCEMCFDKGALPSPFRELNIENNDDLDNGVAERMRRSCLLVEGDQVRIRGSVAELCHGWGPVDSSMVGLLKYVPELDGSDVVDVVVDFPVAPNFVVRLNELVHVCEEGAFSNQQRVQACYVWERVDGDELCHLSGSYSLPLRQVRGGYRRAGADWIAEHAEVKFEDLAQLRAWCCGLSKPETAEEKALSAAPLCILRAALIARPKTCTVICLQKCVLGPAELRFLGPALVAQVILHLKSLVFCLSSFWSAGVSARTRSAGQSAVQRRRHLPCWLPALLLLAEAYEAVPPSVTLDRIRRGGSFGDTRQRLAGHCRLSPQQFG